MTIYACKLIDAFVNCTSMIPAWTSMRIIDTLRVPPMMRINIHGDALSLIVSNKTDSCAFFGVDLACCFSSFLELIWPAVSHRISVFLELIWPAVSHRISVFWS